MNGVLRVVAGAAGVLFVSIGLGWWIAPATVGAQLGMTLLDGAGLSTQIGDLASFFLTAGGCILAALATNQRLWLYPAIGLIGLAALGRTLAWLVHDAALLYDTIAFEIVVTVVLYATSRTLGDPRSQETT